MIIDEIMLKSHQHHSKNQKYHDDVEVVLFFYVY